MQESPAKEKTPAAVRSGAELKKKNILAELAKLPDEKARLAPAEELLFFARTSLDALKKKGSRLEHCMFMTSQRLVVIEKKASVHNISLANIGGVAKQKTLKKVFTIVLTMATNELRIIEIASKEVADFFAEQLHQRVLARHTSRTINIVSAAGGDEDVLEVPVMVLHEQDILKQNVLGTLKDTLALGEREKPLYYCKMDEKGGAVLTTTRRFIHLEGTKITLTINRFDVRDTSYRAHPPCLSIILMNGASKPVSMANAETAQFFCHQLNAQIRERDRLNTQSSSSVSFVARLEDDSFNLASIKTYLLTSPIFKDYHVGLKTYRKCVRGNKLVSLLVTKGYAADRGGASLLAQALFAHGLKHVSGAMGFRDQAKCFYTFGNDVDPSSPSDRRVTVAPGPRIAVQDEDDSPEMPADMLKAIILRSGLVRTHKVKKVSYPSSIIGSELISWLVQNRHASDRVTAIDVCSRLFEVGLIAYGKNGGDSMESVQDTISAVYEFKVMALSSDSGGMKSRTPSMSQIHSRAHRDRDFSDVQNLYIVSEFSGGRMVLESVATECPGADERDFELVLAHHTGARSQKWRRNEDGTITSALPAVLEGKLEGLPIWLYDRKWTFHEDTGYITSKKDDAMYYLKVKGVCCGHPDCEKAQLRVGMLVCMEEVKKEDKLTVMHEWRVANDFEMFMDDLLTPVLDDLLALEPVEGKDTADAPTIPFPKFIDWDDFELVWRGSLMGGGEGMLSVWTPSLPSTHVLFGHWAHASDTDPPAEARMLTAPDCPGFRKPKGYELVFAHHKAGLFVWLPLPPDTTHAALGCVATADSSPPPLDLVRCVDKSMLIETEGLASFFIVTPKPALLMNPSPDEKRPLPEKAHPGWKVDGVPVVSANGSVQLGVVKVNCHYNTQKQTLFVGIFEARSLPGQGADGVCTAYVHCRLHPAKLGKKVRTAAISNTYFPVFNETFQMPLEKELLVTSMLDFKVKHIVLGRKGVEIGRFRIALNSIPHNITKEEISTSIMWQALQPSTRDKSHDFGRAISFWRVASLDTFLMGNEHAKPLLAAYRFPPQEQEKVDQRAALEKKGLQLLYECGKQLEGGISKRLKSQTGHLAQMARLLSGHTPGKPLSSDATEAIESHMEDEEIFFDQLREMLGAIADFYHYTDNAEASAPTFRDEVESLRTSLQPIVDAVKVYIHRELVFEFAHFTSIERQAEVLKLVWPAVTKLDAHRPRHKKSTATPAKSPSSALLPPSTSTPKLTSSPSALKLPPSPSSNDLRVIDEDGEEEQPTPKSDTLSGDMSVHARTLLEDHLSKRFQAYFKQDAQLRTEQAARVKPRAMRHASTDRKEDISGDEEDDDDAVSLDSFLGGDAKTPKTEHLPVPSPPKSRENSITSVSNNAPTPSKATQPKTILDYFPLLLSELRSVLRDAGQEIAAIYYAQYHKRLMPMVKLARLSPGGCIVCVGFLQDFIAVAKKIQPPELSSDILEMEICIDIFMDEYDKQSKDKVISWVSNLVLKEQTAEAKSFNSDNNFLYTYGPSDLFLNLNTAFNAAVETHKLKGRALSRVGSVYAHVLNYYIETLSTFFSANRSLHPPDTPFEETIDPRAVYEEKDADEMLNPAVKYLLAQVNNAKLYEENTEELRDYCVGSLDPNDEYRTQLETLFDRCAERFAVLAEKCAGILADWLVFFLRPVFPRLFGPSWNKIQEMLSADTHREAVSSRFSDVFEVFMNAIEREVFVKYFFKLGVPRLGGVHVLYLAKHVPKLYPKNHNPMEVANCIRADRQMMLGFLETYLELADEVFFAEHLNLLNFVSQMLCCNLDLDTLTPTVKLLLAPLRQDPLAKFHMSMIISNLLALRGDISERDVRKIVAGLVELEKTLVKERNQASEYSLKVLIDCGKNLLKKQKPYAPYAKVKLTNADGSLVYAKFKTKPVKSERPDWNTLFNDFDPAHVRDFQCFRFEVWDANGVHELVGTAVISKEQLRKKEFVETEQLKEGVRLDLPLDGSVKKEFWNKPGKEGEERIVVGTRTTMVGNLMACVWFHPKESEPVYDPVRRTTLTDNALTSALEASKKQRAKQHEDQLQQVKSIPPPDKKSPFRGFFASQNKKPSQKR